MRSGGREICGWDIRRIYVQFKKKEKLKFNQRRSKFIIIFLFSKKCHQSCRKEYIKVWSQNKRYKKEKKEKYQDKMLIVLHNMIVEDSN